MGVVEDGFLGSIQTVLVTESLLAVSSGDGDYDRFCVQN